MKNSNSLKNQVVSGLIWKFGERIIAQAVSFIVSIVLARMLIPEQYGTIALVIVFINIANVFVSNGLGEALIQKKDAEKKDFSTMFYCSILLSIILYCGLFISAPFIANFYNDTELIIVIRILSLQIPLAGVKTIQHAYVSKKMLFKKFFFSTIGGTVISGIAGIIMAYCGHGVWALVVQYLTNSLIDMLVLFITVSWRPTLQFDITIAKRLFGYGWKLVAAQFINTLYSNLRNLIIGKIYSTSELAFYNKGDQFPSLIINNINTSISSVLFPAMSLADTDIERLKAITRKSMKVSSYIIFPMMTGMIAVAEPLIRLLLTEKWLPCMPFLRISCVYWMFQPCQTANAQVIKAIGRSDIYFVIEVIKKVIGFILLLGTMNISVYAMAMSIVFCGGISMLINIIPNKKLISYGYIEQFKDLIPTLLVSVFMGGTVYFITYLRFNDIVTIVIQIMLGALIYIFSSYFLKLESFTYILSIVTERFSFKRKR